MGRVLLVVNPAAGAASDATVARLVAACAGHEVVQVHTTGLGSGVGLVSAAVAGAHPPDWVVVAGGDGTASEAAEGIARGLGCWPAGHPPADSPALVLTPLGSGNSLHRALWGPRGWEETVAAALNGDSALRKLDVVHVREEGHGSMLGVNVGLLARIAQLIEARKAEERATVGEVATDDESAGRRYAAAIGEAIRSHEPFPARVTVDGELLYEGPTTVVTVGGLGQFLRGSFHFLPRSVLDDELLDVCVFTDFSAQEFFEFGQFLMSGDHVGRPGVEYAQGRRVVIERADDEPLAVEHDGDPRRAGATVSLEVVPRAVPALAAARVGRCR